MGNRGSKSRMIILVKEQRVDGFSVIYITVRCILVAVKTVFNDMLNLINHNNVPHHKNLLMRVHSLLKRFLYFIC
jgi:hypothetical protein